MKLTSFNGSLNSPSPFTDGNIKISRNRRSSLFAPKLREYLMGKLEFLLDFDTERFLKADTSENLTTILQV